METLLQDVRYAVRRLRRTAALTTVAVLTLGLGVGAATAIFSVVNGVLLRPLPYPDPERIVVLAERGKEGSDVPVAAANLADWRARARGFQAMAAYSSGPAAVLGGAEPVRPEVASVTGDFFRALGVQPSVGRAFTAEESGPGGPPAAVVSHDFWRTQLGGAPLARGTVQVYGTPYPVVGVMPPGFHFPARTGVWLAEGMADPGGRDAHNWSVVARLAPGVPMRTALSSVDGVQRQLRAAYGADEVDTEGVNGRTLHDELVGGVRKPLLLLLGAAALVLLITCVNLASTLLARGAARRQEVAVRAALGADRARIARLLFTESVVVALLGGAAGVAVAALMHRALVAAAPAGALPRVGEVRLDAAALLFALAAALGSALLFGLAPALRASAADLGRTLTGTRGSVGGRGAAWNLLIGAEVALAFVLLAGSGLLVRSFLHVMGQDPGFDARGVLTVDLSLPDGRYPDDAALARFHESFLGEVRTLPGVRHVGAITQLPLSGSGISGQFDIEGREPGAGYAAYRAVAGDYFRSMGIALRRGRFFEAGDRAGVPDVALVNESLAARYWPGENPVGKRIRNLSNDSWLYGEDRWVTVVGVVGDVRAAGLAAEAAPEVYVNAAQRPFRSRYATATLRTTGDPAALVPAVRGSLAGRFGDVPAEFRTMEERVAESVGDRRFTATVLGLFAAVAVVLVAVGVYGVISYRGAQRTREMGVLIALGATPRRVRSRVMGGSLRVVAAGVAVGLVGALALTRLMGGMLYGVSPTDPATFVLGGALLLGIGALASWIPAVRATRVDPMVALRSE